GNDVPAGEEDAAKFAGQLRNLTVNAFKTNEFIGENVLAYAPVPGQQKGCVDLMETTGGKAWSL
ncbi:MAG: gluconate 2-dehydrogenase subunit 3 family protein, partial [Flavobacteriaceae bacterium]|nr:gluconate 2-dehydrogenase subunit 3 family protein [Flavobacteriaceae bacterium]